MESVLGALRPTAETKRSADMASVVEETVVDDALADFGVETAHGKRRVDFGRHVSAPIVNSPNLALISSMALSQT